ncbi:MAG: hypothetical protein KatS3mg057_1479 [Herpetosiphonaceae bacterium]|nr:MAG: hypothetical protein KatS3mg057_1479 [Herpetosiphonaceae bacterium]
MAMPDRPDDAAERARDMLRETGVARVMTSTSVDKHPTAFFHTGLPILRAALSPQMMSATLAPVLQPLSSNGSAPIISYAQLLAYKQGNRGLIRYELAGAVRDDLVVFGKLYPDPERAMRVYDIMWRLWNQVFAGQQEIGVPQPLGWIPELAMLVYVPTEGALLGEAVVEAQALRYMRLAGTWLGTLHASQLPLDRQLRLPSEIMNAQMWAEEIAQSYPEGEEAARRIAAYLQEQGQSIQFETEVPIHKDFHYAHIVVNGGLHVIDLDEMRRGDPNFDLAHFCANLHLLSYRKKSAPYQFSALQNAFLDAYARRTGWMSNERFVYFYAYTCLKIARQICSRRGPRPRPEGAEQRAQTQLMLDQGLAALPHGARGRLAGKFATQIIDRREQNEGGS